MFINEHKLTSLTQKESSPFKEKRSVFAEGSKRSVERAEAREARERTQEEIDRALREGVDFKNTPKQVTDALAEIIDPKNKQRKSAELLAALEEGLKKEYPKKSMREIWQFLSEKKADRVTLEKMGDEYYFQVYRDKEAILVTEKSTRGIPIQDEILIPKIEAPAAARPAAPRVAPATRPAAPKAAPAEAAPERYKGTLEQFKKWFPKAEIYVRAGVIAPGSYYIENVEEGRGQKIPLIYSPGKSPERASYSRVSGEKFTSVRVLERVIISIDKIEYVHTDKGWVRFDRIRKERTAGKELIPDSEFSMPEKYATTVGRIEKGPHYVARETEFKDKKGQPVETIPASRRAPQVQVIDEGVYQIGPNKYVKIRYRGKEGLVRYDDLYTAQEATVQPEAQAEKRQEQVQQQQSAEQQHKYVQEDGTIEFPDRKTELAVRLSHIFPQSKAGDKIEVTRKGRKESRTATFRNGEFYYDDGNRAKIYNGYRIGKLETVRAERETPPEGIISIGSVKLSETPLKTYLEIAKAVLGKSKAELEKLGFQINSEKQLKDLQASRMFPYDYARQLQRFQKGETIFLPLIPKQAAQQLEETQREAEERKFHDSEKLKKRDKRILKEHKDKVSGKDKFVIRKNVYELAHDKEAWNKAWDIDGAIEGVEHLAAMWRQMPPYNRSENELRDIVRLLILEADRDRSNRRKAKNRLSLENFFKIAKVYEKEGGGVGTYEDFQSEKKKVEREYNNINPNLRKLYASGKVQRRFEEIYRKIQMNRQMNRDSLYGLSAKDREDAMALNDSRYKTFERYHELNSILNASVLTMDAITHLRYITTEKERVRERKLNTAEQRVNEIFDRNNKGTTMTAIAGEEGKEGVTTEWRLLPWLKDVPVLNILASNWKGGSPEWFNKYSCGEAAFMRVLDKCRNPKTGEVNEKRLLQELNYLLQLGIYGMVRNPSIEQKKLFEAFNIDPKAKDRDKQLYEVLEIESLDEAINKRSKEGRARILLIRTGYIIDERSSEGRTEIVRSGEETVYQKIETMDELSDVPAIRRVQYEALKRGYPAKDVKDIEEKMKSRIVGGVIVDLGTYRDGEKVREGGVGGGVGIDIGHGFKLGLGVGNFDGEWQMAFGLSYGGKISERVEGGVGFGASMPLEGSPRLAPAVGAGLEYTIPIDKSSWDGFISAGVGVPLREEISVGGGVIFGMKWNPTKALDNATRERLEEYQLTKIDDALAKGNRPLAAELIRQHPRLGKLVTYLELRYNWTEDDVIRLYEDTKAALRNAAVQDINPVITRFGIGPAATIGPEGVAVGPAVVVAISIQKTVKLYRTESARPYEMIARGSRAMDQEIMRRVHEQFPEATSIEWGTVTVKEDRPFIIEKDGQMGVGIRRRSFDLSKITTTENPKLADYNAELGDSGVQLKEGRGEMKGLLEVVITDLEDKKDPAYNKRSLSVFIDPALKSKGLILRGGKIYLSAASPNLYFRRLDYYTPKPDKDGATAHSIITISDLPTRNERDIMDASRFFMYKRPGKPVSRRSRGEATDIKQNNVLHYSEFRGSKSRFESYREKGKDWAPYQNAANERMQNFVVLSEQQIRAGLVEGDDSFSARFYKKNRKLYKELTTYQPGSKARMEDLARRIQAAYKAENPSLPELNDVEMNRVMQDLTQRSWHALSENPQAKEYMYKKRLEWAKKTLLPLWRQTIENINRRNPGTITHSAEELVTYAVEAKRGLNLEQPPDSLSEGSLTTTLAGSENIRGWRPNVGAIEVLGHDEYAAFLGTHTEQGEIARIILETQSPLSETDAEFMQNPLALQVYSKLALILPFGPDRFRKVTQCFESGTVAPENSEAFNEFRKLVNAIREAQVDPSGRTVVSLEEVIGSDGKGYYIGLTPLELGTAVDPTCANFTITMNGNFNLVLFRGQKVRLAKAGARVREHMTLEANELYSIASFAGAGLILADVTPPPPHPPTTTHVPPGGEVPPPPPPPPEPAPAPGVGTKPGEQGGGEITSQPGTVGGGGGGEEVADYGAGE